ncbi:hypothetical protein [Cyclobacterium plantarum]|uniref:Lipoprotein n=1 Tax=Cyclobacterium plantarum TaxID=2716263 RepID=A0ABX0HCE3_9BACT|nr:hypothetical protein [Cyclobacterium plantarum]NHE57635.1 hypothetical protein [Cyclobacterium plantarum]
MKHILFLMITLCAIMVCSCQTKSNQSRQECTVYDFGEKKYLCCDSFDKSGNLISTGSFTTKEFEFDKDSLVKDTLPIHQHNFYDSTGRLKEILKYGFVRKKSDGKIGSWDTEPQQRIIFTETGDTNYTSSFYYRYTIDTVGDSINHSIYVHAKENNAYFLDYYFTEAQDSLITLLDTTKGLFTITRGINEQQPFIGRLSTSKIVNGKLQHKYDLSMFILGSERTKKKKACT